MRFCIVSSNELVVLDSLENIKQYKNAGKRFRVYGAWVGRCEHRRRAYSVSGGILPQKFWNLESLVKLHTTGQPGRRDSIVHRQKHFFDRTVSLVFIDSFRRQLVDVIIRISCLFTLFSERTRKVFSQFRRHICWPCESYIGGENAKNCFLLA